MSCSPCSSAFAVSSFKRIAFYITSSETLSPARSPLLFLAVEFALLYAPIVMLEAQHLPQLALIVCCLLLLCAKEHRGLALVYLVSANTYRANDDGENEGVN